MAETEQPPRVIVLRCPVCFARENDVTLMHNGSAYYCVHCSFHGSADQVMGMYADLRKKYQWIRQRVTLDELRRL